MINAERALVVFSGGQDSTTCLYWAMKQFNPENTEAIFFEYGQRHQIEKQSAIAICEFANIPLKIVPINSFAHLGDNSLVGTGQEFDSAVDHDSGLPKTFVPGRNLIFITFAAAYGYKKNIKKIITGVSQTDFSGYPDCRRKTMDHLERALNAGMEKDFSILTPLIDKTKAETVKLARQLGAMEAMGLSHTCYQGQKPPCGECPACKLRAKGFAEAGIKDPLFG